jgi:hypothetical protein
VKKIFKIFGSLVLILILAFSGFVGWKLYPHENPQPLLFPLVSSTSEEGVALLESSEVRVDYSKLSKTFQAQKLASYCGVASSVAVLRAMGKDVNQSNFFTDGTSKVRSQLKVMFRGMSLPVLGAMLEAHGVKVSVHYADQSSVEQFRSVIEKNLANADDYLIVNYQRKLLGENPMGHISPLAAYNRKSDEVLIMDTTSNKYPPTWVPVDMLFDAMMTTDPASGKMRGYIEVSKI